MFEALSSQRQCGHGNSHEYRCTPRVCNSSILPAVRHTRPLPLGCRRRNRTHADMRPMVSGFERSLLLPHDGPIAWRSLLTWGDPAMPTITLRRLRTDLASKLDQLEARAIVLERNARRSTGVDLAPASPPLLYSALSAWLRIVQHTKRSLRKLDQTARSPVADALPVTNRSLNGAVVYFSLACGLLLASALAMPLVAPPY